MKLYIPALFIFTALAAYADIDCGPGSYINSSGNCTECGAGFYCPDGETNIRCPALTSVPGLYGNTWCVTDKYPSGSNFGCDSDVYCVDVHNTVTCPHGKIRVRAYYDPVTKKYTSRYHIAGDDISKMQCDPGYYWTWKTITTDPAECEADCIPVGFGYYSTGDGYTRTKCPQGYGTQTDVSESQSECQELCRAGFTKLHISSKLSFNVYANQMTVPALAIQGSGKDACYVNMAPNEGDVNITFDNKTYHIVN